MFVRHSEMNSSAQKSNMIWYASPERNIPIFGNQKTFGPNR